MIFSKFYFSSVIVFTIFNYEPNFKEKFLRESGFPIWSEILCREIEIGFLAAIL